MCMEDVRIGRRTTSRSFVVNTTATVKQQVLSGSDDRIALMLGAPAAGTLTYFDQANITAAVGFNVGAGQPPITLTIQEHGDIVRHQWWVIDDGTGRTGLVIETLLPEK